MIYVDTLIDVFLGSEAENQVALSMTKLKLAYSPLSHRKCNHSENGCEAYHQKAGLKVGETKTNLLWLSNFVYHLNCISKSWEMVEACSRHLCSYFIEDNHYFRYFCIEV